MYGNIQVNSPWKKDLNESVPSCPVCNKPMVRKKARRGRNAGKEFWGCSGWLPKNKGCDGILDIEDFDQSSTLELTQDKQNSHAVESTVNFQKMPREFITSPHHTQM